MPVAEAMGPNDARPFLITVDNDVFKSHHWPLLNVIGKALG
jgi:hypothetical protein